MKINYTNDNGQRTTWTPKQEAELCGACGQYMPPVEQDAQGFHKAELCDANDELAEYEGTFRFFASKKLTEEQIAQLSDLISLQMIEPVDENQNDEDYTTSAVRVEIKVAK
jgi:hypothetical protein